MHISILERLKNKEEWLAFFEHKERCGNLSIDERGDLFTFIENGEYLPIADDILNNGCFSPPQKVLLNKSNTDKKRTVYVYRREENYVLKLIAYMLSEYDGIFSPNLYSFRKNNGVKNAINDILKLDGISGYYAYKLDISDYFNSVDIEKLLPMLENALANDPALYSFLRSVLEYPYALYNDEPTYQKRGIMAGVPVSGFLADLYLSELDAYFFDRGIPYARYSDDIIVFAKNENELEACISYIKSVLDEKGLKINSKKESVSQPYTEWTVLGFSYNNGEIDICRASVEKLKRKMRRKSRALCRWADKNNVDRIKACRVFIRCFNRKLFDNPRSNELTWTRWFFPVISTDRSLHQIDLYMQDCIRYIATGKRNKSRFEFRYGDMKEQGYVSLVNKYYKNDQSVSLQNEKMQKYNVAEEI